MDSEQDIQTVSVIKWILIIIISLIPIINIIFLIIGILKFKNPNLKTYSEAILIIIAMLFIVSFIFKQPVFYCFRVSFFSF